MYEIKDVYSIFYEVKNQKKVNWDSIKNKLSEENLKIIQDVTNKFNTLWQDINIYEFMGIGCVLWKGFSPKHFLNEKLIKEYIRIDKNKKRNLDIPDSVIEKSFEYIHNRYVNLDEYGKTIINGITLPVYDYLRLKIDTITLTYMIYRNLISISNTDNYLIPYIVSRFNDIKQIVMKKEDFLNDLEEKYERTKETE